MPAFAGAVAAGARWLECDVQFTADMVPVILHDAHLQRLCGLDASINQYRAETVSDLHLHEPERLGRQFINTPILRLTQFLAWFGKQKGLNVFLEIKPDILRYRSPEEVAETLQPLLGPERMGITLISSSATILQILSAHLQYPLGWVVKGPAPAVEIQYVFLKEAMLELLAHSYHQQGVQVAAYTVDEPDRFHKCLDRGADLIETNRFSRLSSQLSQGP